MKKLALLLLALAGLSLVINAQGRKPKIKDTTYQPLPFSQDWTNLGLITVNDDWSAVPGINGYRGDNLTITTGVDPSTITADSMRVVDVNANQLTPNTFTSGGLTEFEITNPTIALAGSGTADAPFLVLFLNTTGFKAINVSYTLRDLEDGADNAIQAVAVQYRIGNSGAFTNIPAGFVADATVQNAVMQTPVSFTLPEVAENQAAVQLRIITTNAAGNDEWVGVDDILINGDPLTGGKPKVSLSLSSISISEGSLDPVTVTVNSTEAVTGDQTVEVAISGMGINSTDYELSSTTVTILDGQTSGSTSLSILDDSEIEGTENAVITIQTPSEGIQLGAAITQELEIIDNDANEVRIYAELPTVDEAGSTFLFQIQTTQNTSASESVSIEITGTATENSDFTIVSKTIDIPFGTKLVEVPVSILEDSDYEGNETVTITISSVSGGLLLSTEKSISFSITDNDPLSPISVLEARNKTIGSIVIVRGTVTASFKGNVGATIAFQDATAGVQLYHSKADNLVPGDSIYVQGKTSDRFGAIQIVNVDSLLVYPVKGKVVPKVINTTGVTETYESQLILIKNLKFPAGTFAGNTNYVGQDRVGQVEMRITGTTNNIIGTAIPSDSVDVVGLLAQFNAFYQIQPRSLADFVAIGGVNNVALSASTSAASEAEKTQITLTATTVSTVNSAQTVDIEVTGTGITAEDYTLSSTTITIPAGSTSGSATLTIVDDSADEGVEVASVTLVNPSAGLSLGSKTVGITISDNDSVIPKDYIAVAEARNLALGTIVTVTGRITVANELGGPAYFQDNTAGMGVFETTLHTAVAIGDSVKITGPLAEFGSKTGEPGTGLFQISGAGTTFQVFKENNKKVEPKIISLADVNESLEGQLVKILNVTTDYVGAYQANKNYNISDPSGPLNLGMRVDNNTNLVGATAPTAPFDLIGVVSQFSGSYQIIPRFTEDLGVQAFVIPGENVARSETFEIGTWNMKWFGVSALSGYIDSLQTANAIKLLRTMNLDLYAVQEVTNNVSWQTLMDSLKLKGYRGFIAPISQAQKTGFIYKDATIDSVNARFAFNTGDWGSGRFPYEFTFDVTVNGITKRITAINIHAKATTSTPPEDDLNRREMDAIQLKSYLDANRSTDNVIVLGDYNDDVIKSTVGTNLPSPYANFVSDPASYTIVTKFLSEKGQTSYRSSSMLDHILITNEMYPMHWDSTQRIENPFYIGSYLSSTSDHFPVWTRFRLEKGTDVAETGTTLPSGFVLMGNYPNPFNPTTSIRFSLPYAGDIKLDVFNTLGQRVATDSFTRTAGSGSYDFNAARLTSGVYFYTLTFNNKAVSSKFMILK
ncbi:MAG: T9SS type A sorting domain-containing protein [Bacteroidetes bacterium]|nr:T9SS type A sorting domain-containing protein [Bacteroidota bacterium]